MDSEFWPGPRLVAGTRRLLALGLALAGSGMGCDPPSTDVADLNSASSSDTGSPEEPGGGADHGGDPEIPSLNETDTQPTDSDDGDLSPSAETHIPATTTGDTGATGDSTDDGLDSDATDGAEDPKDPGGYECQTYVDTTQRIDDLVVEYNETRWYATVLDALGRRYPSGRWLLDNTPAAQLRLSLLLDDRRTFDRLFASVGPALAQLTTELANTDAPDEYQLMIAGDDEFQDVASIPDSHLMARGQIIEHLPQELRHLPCTEDFLKGHAGTMGIEATLSDLNAQTHRLYTDYAFGERLIGGQASRDGMVCLMFFIEVYLAELRRLFPRKYANLAEAPQLRPLLVKLWDRADCLLKLTAADIRLGTHDHLFVPHIFDPIWLAEIDELRQP